MKDIVFSNVTLNISDPRTGKHRYVYARNTIYDSETGILREETDREFAGRIGRTIEQVELDKDLADAAFEAAVIFGASAAAALDQLEADVHLRHAVDEALKETRAKKNEGPDQ